jgi:hypothetical protein
MEGGAKSARDELMDAIEWTGGRSMSDPYAESGAW